MAKYRASAPEGLTEPGQWQPVSGSIYPSGVQMETKGAADTTCDPQSLEELLDSFWEKVVKLGIVV